MRGARRGAMVMHVLAPAYVSHDKLKISFRFCRRWSAIVIFILECPLAKH